jgi:DNA-directed RNA polymerase subunit RPC12/RpoP
MFCPELRVVMGVAPPGGALAAAATSAEWIGVAMETVLLTCVSCGKTREVPNNPDAKRSQRCSECGSPILEMRRPGDTSHIPAQN